MGPTRIAEFEVERELGRGAMGTVYLARRGAERVAVKVIRPDLVGTPEAMARFRREADLGGRVVHPNVVRTLGSGVTTVDGAEVPYLVMEYVQGKDLRALLQDLGSVPEALLREIAVQIAAGLEAIHAAGAVHRDVKPENVLVTEANEVRIMDLGVARLSEATVALTQEGSFTGTLLYAAPEQFLEEDVGPAADLYALGVVLYELATGTQPFHRSTSLAVMRAHAEFVPVPASEVQGTVSPFLSELVATLLAKRPEDRFADAATLRRTLAEGERSSWWQARASQSARRRDRRPRIPVERATAAYGRRADLEALSEAWGEALSGAGGVVLVEGEAGIGKTRLLDELVASLGAGTYHVLYGAFGPSGGLSGLTQAIVDDAGEGDLAGRLAPHLQEFSGLVPAFAARLRDESPPQGVPTLPAEAVPTLACRYLQGLAEEAPVLWLVDDVHLAREEGLRLLVALARSIERRRVLLVVSSQEGGLPDAERSTLGALPRFRHRRLSRLGPRDVVLLLAEALKSDRLAESLGGKVAAESDGVPLFVLELLRTLGEGGLLKRQADGSFVQLRRLTTFTVPSTVKGLVTMRLKGLTDEDRELLDVAAVQGGEFDAGAVARLLDLKPVLALRRLAVIERRTGMIRAAGARYRFDQKQIQETLYEELPPELREEYHALLAEDLAEGKEAPLAGRDAYGVALHHVKGARPTKALPHLEAALTFLERAMRNDESIDLMEAALARPGLLEGAPRAELLLRLSIRLAPYAGLAEALPHLRQAIDLAEASGGPGLRARARFFEARLAAVSGRFTEALDGFARARDLAREAGDGELEARAIGSVGVVLDNTGRRLEALPLIEHHLADARSRGDRNSEMIAACNLGLLLRHLGRADEAREMVNLHLRLAVDLGDLRSEAVGHGNLALIEADQGHDEAACAQYELNLALARKTGSRGSEAIACMNLGLEQLTLGRVDRALSLLEQGRALLHELGDVVSEASAERNLGAALTKVGRFEEALDRYERALPMARVAGDRDAEASAHLEHATVLWRLGRSAAARAAIEAALAIAREARLPKAEATALLDGARLEQAEGRPAAAAELLEQAATRIAGLCSDVLEARITLARAALPGGDVAAAERALLGVAARIPMPQRAEEYHRLWRLTRDESHLAAARRLLCEWVAELSPALRDGLEDRMPSYRAIRLGLAEAAG